MKQKSVSRLKLIFMLLPIMALAFYVLSSIMGGSASIFVPSEAVEHVSDMAAPPASGSPTDYTPMENWAFANWRIYNASYFEAESEGVAKADIGFTKYSQSVRNLRKVKNKNVFTETVSVSALVKNAEQMYINSKDAVAYRTSASVHGNSVSWSDEILPMSTTTFFARYGSVPREITKYALTSESVTKAELVSFGGGIYTYEFELDPEIGGKYFRNEIATRAGSNDLPQIISMKLTVTMDENWYVQSTTSVDCYKISIPALGALTTTSEMTEVFRYIDEDRELPESEMFEPYLPKAGDDVSDIPVPGEKNASEYLAQAFAPYMDGEPLNLSADINLLGSSHNLALGLDLKSMNVNVLLDDAIYVGYDGKNAYIDAGALKGKLPIEELSRPEIKELMSSNPALGGIISGIDIKNEMADDILGALFDGSELTVEDGIAAIRLDFKLSDLLKENSSLKEFAEKAELKVDMLINDGETPTLRGIDAQIKISSLPVKVKITPTSAPTFPSTDGMPSLSPVLDFITPIANTAKGEAFKLAADLDLGDMQASAEITLNRDLTFEGDIFVPSLNVSVHTVYDGKTVYMESGNLKFKLDCTDFGSLLEKADAALKAFGIDVSAKLPDIENLKNTDIVNVLAAVLESDLNELLSHLTEVSFDKGSLSLGVSAGGNSFTLSLAHDDNYLTALGLNALVGGSSIKLGADLTVLDTARPVTPPVGEYADINEIADFLPVITDAVNADGYAADIDVAFGDIAMSGDIRLIRKEHGIDAAVSLYAAGAEVRMTLKDGILYVECGQIRLCADADDLDAVAKTVSAALSYLGLGDKLPNLDGLHGGERPDLGNILLTLVKSATAENGEIKLALSIGGAETFVTISRPAPYPLALSIETNVGGRPVSLDITLKQLGGVKEIETPNGDFSEVKHIAALADSVMNAATYSYYEFMLSAAVSETEIEVALSLNKDLSCAEARISVPSYGVNADIIFNGGTLYLSVLGVNVKADKTDLDKALAFLLPKLPQEVQTGIQTVLSALDVLKNGDKTEIGEMISSLIPSGDKPLDLGELSEKLTRFSCDEKGLYLEVSGTDIRLTRNDGLPEKLSVSPIKIGDVSLDLSLTLKSVSETAKEITPKDVEYSALKDVISLAEDALATLGHAAYEIGAAISVNGIDISLTLKLNSDLSAASVRAEIPTYDITADVLLLNKTLYISALGFDFKTGADGLDALEEQLLKVLPGNYADILQPAFAAVKLLLSHNDSEPLSPKALIDEVRSQILPLVKGDTSKIEKALNALSLVLDGNFKGAIDSVNTDSAIQGGNTDLSSIADRFALSFRESAMDFSCGSFALTVAHGNNALSGIALSAGGISANISIKTLSEPFAMSADVSKKYLDAADLSRFLAPIVDLAKDKAFYFDFEATVSIDSPASTQKINGNAELLFTENGMALQIKLLLQQQDGTYKTLAVAYENERIYIVYDGVAVEASLADGERIKDLVSPILPAFAPRLIDEVMKAVTDNMPDTDVRSLLGMIERVYMQSENELCVEISAFSMPIKMTLTLGKDESGAEVLKSSALGINVSQDVYLDALITLTDSQRETDGLSPSIIAWQEKNGGFTPASDLIDQFSALLSTFTQDAYDVTLDGIEVNYPDQNRKDLVSGHIKFLPTNKGIPNLVADIFVSQKRGETVKTHTFDIMITDGDPLQEIYLTYNGVNFKLTIDEVLYLLGNVKDVLSLPDGTILDRVLPAGREIVSGEFLKDFDIAGFDEISETAGGALVLLTQVIDEAKDFMYDPDYDYREISNTAKEMLRSLTALLGMENSPSPDVRDLFDMLTRLPNISLKTVKAEGALTMDVDVNGTGFTLTSNIQGKPYLSHWGMTDLKSKQTIGSFSVSMVCPDKSTEEGSAAIERIAQATERPKYHDYTHATSTDGTYKKQELKERIMRGEIEGVSLPYADYGYINYFETFEESLIIPEYVHTEGRLIKTTYVTVRTGDDKTSDYRKDSYFGQPSFVERMNNEEIVAVYKGKEPYTATADTVEYQTKSYYESKVGILLDNGTQTTFDEYFTVWFEKNYGMPVDDYTAKYLDGHVLNDLSDMVSLTTALLNTANLKDFHITATLNVNILGFIKTNVPLDVRVKIVSGKPLVIVNMQTDSVALGTLKKSASQIYYYEGQFYFVKLDDGKKYNYIKVSLEQMLSDMKDTDTMMKYVYFVAPLSSLVQNAVNNAINDSKTQNEPGAFEDYFKGYYYKNNGHYLTLDIGTMTGNTAFSEAQITIGTGLNNVGDYASKVFGENETVFGDTDRTFVNTLRLKTSISGLVTLTLNANMGIGETVDTFRIPSYSGSNIVYGNDVAIADLPAYLAAVSAFIESSPQTGTIDDVATRTADVWLNP